jgi:hypothetical protein
MSNLGVVYVKTLKSGRPKQRQQVIFENAVMVIGFLKQTGNSFSI